MRLNLEETSRHSILIGAEKKLKKLSNIGFDENYKIKIVNSTDKQKKRKIC